MKALVDTFNKEKWWLSLGTVKVREGEQRSTQHPPEHVRLEDQEVDAAEDRGHDQDEGHADGALALGQVPLPPTQDPTRLDHTHSGHQ